MSRPLTQSRQRVNEPAPTRFLCKSEIVVQASHRVEIDVRCDVRRVQADAVQPGRFAGIAAVLDDDGPSLPLVAAADERESRGDQEVTEGPCGAHDERVAALAHQVEAQIGDISIGRPSPVWDRVNRLAIRSLVYGSPIALASVSARNSACALNSEACARSSNVNETGLDALYRFTESPHDKGAKLRREHEVTLRVSQPAEDAVVRPAWNGNTNLRT